MEALCAAFPNEPVALYAGGSASFVQRGQSRTKTSRELIKGYIQSGDIRLVCATDAACEGLVNLQRLGAQVNIDMPWNPSRLEQRKGRIQRIGQARDNVHVLSLRYADTVEDEVYAALSHRFGDILAVLGQLPDAFEDDWIAAVLTDRSAVRHFSKRIDTTKPPMELRYLRDVADDDGLDWEYTEKVLFIARNRRLDAQGVVRAAEAAGLSGEPLQELWDVELVRDPLLGVVPMARHVGKRLRDVIFSRGAVWRTGNSIAWAYWLLACGPGRERVVEFNVPPRAANMKNSCGRLLAP